MSNMEEFKPKPGQVDFAHIRWAPVINYVVRYKGKMLLVRRSKDLHFYPGYWNGVSGFLDDKKSLKQKVEEEIREELGISRTHIRKISFGAIFHQDAPKYKKTWIVHPVLVEVDIDKIQLDREGVEYQWGTFLEIQKLRLLPGLSRVIDEIANL